MGHKYGCGKMNCGTSWSIADEISYGFGKLDDYGFFETPCTDCYKTYDFMRRNSYGVALQGANFIKVYHKKNKGSFTIPQKYFNELW